MAKRILAFLFFLLFTAAMGGNGYCLMAPIRIQELVKEADVILVGSVQDVTVDENTYVEVAVSEYIMNKIDETRTTIVIRTEQAGLTPDGLMWITHDEPEFTQGEEVVLILEKDDGQGIFGNYYTPKDYTVVGRFQGKFDVAGNLVGYNDGVKKKSGNVPIDKFKAELLRISADPFGYQPNFFNE